MPTAASAADDHHVVSERSILRIEPRSGGQTRFRMLATVRDLLVTTARKIVRRYDAAD
jgi:hypothetical protein